MSSDLLDFVKYGSNDVVHVLLSLLLKVWETHWHKRYNLLPLNIVCPHIAPGIQPPQALLADRAPWPPDNLGMQ